MPHRRFTIREVAAHLHLSVQDVEQLAHHGEIPFERQGDRLVFVKKDVDVWASRRILGFSELRLTNFHRTSSARAHDLSQNHAIIAELLRPESIEPALKSRTKPAVLRDMAAAAVETGLVMDPDGLLLSLQQREALCSTGMPGGLALLHPRHHDPYMFSDSFILLARAAHPVHFGAPDGQPTDIFFLICSQDDRVHLHTLARLCVMCLQTRLLPALRAAEGARELFGAIVKAETETIAGL